MRCNRNMKGFNSLRALYLFENKTKLKALENESIEKDMNHYGSFFLQKSIFV